MAKDQTLHTPVLKSFSTARATSKTAGNSLTLTLCFYQVDTTELHNMKARVSPVALQLRAPPKVSARAPAHRSYHFRGVKLKSCIKKIHHNLYISKQANVRIKHADTEGASRHRCQSSVGHLCRHCETKAMTLKNMKKL